MDNFAISNRLPNVMLSWIGIGFKEGKLKTGDLVGFYDNTYEQSMITMQMTSSGLRIIMLP